MNSTRVISVVHNTSSFDCVLLLHTHKPRSRTEAGDPTVATCSRLLGTYQIKGTIAAPCLLPTDTRQRLHATTGRAVDLAIDLSISLVHRERCVIYCNLMLVCHSPILTSYESHAPYPAYKMKQRKYTVSTVSLKENYIWVRVYAYRPENGLIPARNDEKKQNINHKNKECDKGSV